MFVGHFPTPPPPPRFLCYFFYCISGGDSAFPCFCSCQLFSCIERTTGKYSSTAMSVYEGTECAGGFWESNKKQMFRNNCCLEDKKVRITSTKKKKKQPGKMR